VDKVLTVDLEHPEDNGEVLVMPFTNHVNYLGNLVNGFIIEPKHVDIREICGKQNQFKAFLMPSRHEVMLLTPSVSRPFLESSKQLYEKQEEFHVFSSVAKEGREVVKNSILADANRQVRCIILKFPEEMQLTTEFASDDKRAHGVIPMQIFAIESEYMMGATKCSANDIFLQWVVHILEDVPRVAVFSEDSVTNDAAAQLAARLSGMKF
jgi:hypothetical protein